MIVLLLPVYFAFTGCARTGPAGGSMALLTDHHRRDRRRGRRVAAARCTGLLARVGAVGVLMNTRGLVELIILNIGLDLGVLSPALFSAMVLMALVTTFMTSPLLGWILRPRA